MTLSHLHFFHRQEHPVPGSSARPVTYPACAWRGTHAEGQDLAMHPLNRFVCSWLTSDMTDVAHCNAVLYAFTQLENHHIAQWFVDGPMFAVDCSPHAVQFNASHVGPADAEFWNLPEARFALGDVKAYLQAWRDFLARPDLARDSL